MILTHYVAYAVAPAVLMNLLAQCLLENRKSTQKSTRFELKKKETMPLQLSGQTGTEVAFIPTNV